MFSFANIDNVVETIQQYLVIQYLAAAGIRWILSCMNSVYHILLCCVLWATDLIIQQLQKHTTEFTVCLMSALYFKCTGIKGDSEQDKHFTAYCCLPLTRRGLDLRNKEIYGSRKVGVSRCICVTSIRLVSMFCT